MSVRKPAGRATRPIRLALTLAAGVCLGLGLGLASATDAHAQRLSVLKGAHVATTALRVAYGATAEGIAACPAGAVAFQRLHPRACISIAALATSIRRSSPPRGRPGRPTSSRPTTN